MKLLKIEDQQGFFRSVNGEFVSLEKITKEDILQLVDLVLVEELVDIDAYSEETLKNQAHQIIYKSVSRKLNDLRERRQDFRDAAARLYLDEYQRYGIKTSG